MKNKIKVGDYIRTKEWGIAKVNRIDNGKVTMIKNKNNRTTHYFTQLKEPSQNIIDLIKEGDYINGHRIVNEIYGEDDNELYFEIEGGFNKADYISEKDIKSIVTKEQFKNTEYVI